MLVGNIRYNQQAVNFWRTDFSPKEAEATLTRAETLLGDPYVSHIVSQTRSTIDFGSFIKDGRILLFRLPDTLSTEVKTFIGTIVISELVHAVKLRSTDNPRQFSIFVDEFQQFCGFEDFATLFTQARKYGVATTIAHQERVGQFADNKPIQGATDAAVNRIIFQPSDRDAVELAPGFAREPPTETKREPELVISEAPFDDLLRGHNDAHIRSFVNTYLRKIPWELDNIKDEVQKLRVERMDELDESALYRTDERMIDLSGRRDARRASAMRTSLQGG